MIGIHAVKLTGLALDTKGVYVGIFISSSHLIVRQCIRHYCPWVEYWGRGDESDMVLPLRTLRLSVRISQLRLN